MHWGRGKSTAVIIVLLSQESEEKVHYSAGNCNKGSYCVAASSNCSCAFIQHSLCFLPLISDSHSFSCTDKTFPRLPPHPDWYAAHCSKLLKKILEKASQHDGSFPPRFAGSRSSAVSVCCPEHRRQPVLLWHATTVKLSLQPQPLELMTMWTVVIPHKLPTAAAGGPCLDRDFLSMSLSLSLSFSLSQPRSKRARRAGRQAGSRRVSTPTIWLKHFQPPPSATHTPKASPFLPTSLWQGPAP